MTSPVKVDEIIEFKRAFYPVYHAACDPIHLVYFYEKQDKQDRERQDKQDDLLPNRFEGLTSTILPSKTFGGPSV